MSNQAANLERLRTYSAFPSWLESLFYLRRLVRLRFDGSIVREHDPCAAGTLPPEEQAIDLERPASGLQTVWRASAQPSVVAQYVRPFSLRNR